MILAGDVGGTKTVLGLFAREGTTLTLAREAEFVSRDFPTLEGVIERFLDSEARPQIAAACFGVAGPVIARQSRLTNLPWLLDEAALARFLAAFLARAGGGPQHPRVKLANDLEVTAFGMLRLPPEEFCVLNEGRPPAEPRTIAVIAAGTGLGEAFLFWDGARYRPAATEGGHTDFAPRGREQAELLHYLADELGGNVSFERVLSGAGVVALYHFVRGRIGEPEPAWLAAELSRGDGAAVISAAALARSDLACARALETFAAIYGAEAGNLALKTMALSGVYVGGGIAPKILPELQKGGFMNAFADKGRFSEMMRAIPVKAARHPRAALSGAAYYALEP